jgi:broad specificity phosphatase PhoE
MDGLTHPEFARKYPHEYHARSANKLHYRVSGGALSIHTDRCSESMLLMYAFR